MKFIFLLPLSLFVFFSCNSTKNTTTTPDGIEYNSDDLLNAPQIEFSDETYPKAKEGYVQYSITLPQMNNEEDYIVEFYAGKMMEIDCNNHSLVGEFKEEIAMGWGYSYYEFSKDYTVMSSLMACLDDTKTNTFIQSMGVKTRYNSQLPIVVYVPKDLEVRYSIWKRDGTEKKAELNL